MRDIGLIKQVAELLSGNDFGKRYDRLLHKYNNLSLQNMDASQAFFEILQAARRNNLLGV